MGRATTARVIKIGRPRAASKAAQYLDRAKYTDVDITERELVILRKLVEWEGPAEIAHAVGVSQATLMKVCGGFLPHCRADIRRRLRTFFGERDSTVGPRG